MSRVTNTEKILRPSARAGETERAGGREQLSGERRVPSSGLYRSQKRRVLLLLRGTVSRHHLRDSLTTTSDVLRLQSDPALHTNQRCR